eukprot:7085993-Pyramimonas_sp.AAC.1
MKGGWEDEQYLEGRRKVRVRESGSTRRSCRVGGMAEEYEASRSKCACGRTALVAGRGGGDVGSGIE